MGFGKGIWNATDDSSNSELYPVTGVNDDGRIHDRFTRVYANGMYLYPLAGIPCPYNRYIAPSFYNTGNLKATIDRNFNLPGDYQRTFNIASLFFFNRRRICSIINS